MKMDVAAGLERRDKIHAKLLRHEIDEGLKNRQAGMLEIPHTCKLLIRRGSLMAVRWVTMVSYDQSNPTLSAISSEGKSDLSDLWMVRVHL
jgi:hypothetical protein